MFEQSRVVGALLNRIGQQVFGATTQEQFNQGAKGVLNSEGVANVLDHVNDERIQDRMEGVKKNPEILDRVHISPEAQELYNRQLNSPNAPLEHMHGRKQMGLTPEPKGTPEPALPES